MAVLRTVFEQLKEQRQQQQQLDITSFLLTLSRKFREQNLFFSKKWAAQSPKHFSTSVEFLHLRPTFTNVHSNVVRAQQNSEPSINS